MLGSLVYKLSNTKGITKVMMIREPLWGSLGPVLRIINHPWIICVPAAKIASKRLFSIKLIPPKEM